MKIGLLLTIYNCDKYVKDCLDPWFKLKDKYNIVIASNSGMFNEYKELGIPNRNEKTLKQLITYNIDFQIITNGNGLLNEEDSRNTCLNFLNSQDCDLIWYIDGDETYTEEQIESIIDFINNNKNYDRYELNFKNLTIREHLFMEYKHCRIIWAKRYGGISRFYFDNQYNYNDGTDISQTSYINIPKNTAYIKHYSWLSDDSRTKDKIIYQRYRYRYGSGKETNEEIRCSFRWNDDNDELEFNKVFYSNYGMDIPILHEEISTFSLEFDVNFSRKESVFYINNVNRNIESTFEIYNSDTNSLIYRTVLNLSQGVNYFMAPSQVVRFDDDPNLYSFRVKAYEDSKLIHDEKIHLKLKSDKSNLVYYSVSGNKEYVKLVDLSINSLISNTNYTDDILIICDEFTKNSININYENLKFMIINDVDSNRSSGNKLRIFEYTEISNYNNILYLDSDILISNDISNIFKESELIKDKFIVSSENVNKKLELIINDNWAGHLLTDDEKILYSDIPSINCGSFLFNNNKSNIDILKAIYESYKNGDRYECYEQPYFNYFLLKENKFEFNLQKFISHSSKIDKSKLLHHYCSDPGNFGRKHVFMTRDINILKNLKIENRNILFEKFNKNLKIVEIGVFKGDFSKFIFDKLEPIEFHLIDLFDGNTFSGDKDGNNITYTNMSDEYDKLTTYFKEKNVHLHKGNSSEVMEKFKDEYFDIVYIDGDHSYDGSLADLEVSLRKVKKNGYISGHDYSKEKEPGVFDAVNFFCDKYNLNIEYLTNDGCPTYVIKLSSESFTYVYNKIENRLFVGCSNYLENSKVSIFDNDVLLYSTIVTFDNNTLWFSSYYKLSDLLEFKVEIRDKNDNILDIRVIKSEEFV